MQRRNRLDKAGPGLGPLQKNGTPGGQELSGLWTGSQVPSIPSPQAPPRPLSTVLPACRAVSCGPGGAHPFVYHSPGAAVLHALSRGLRTIVSSICSLSSVGVSDV